MTFTYLLTITIVTLSGSFHFGYQMGAYNGASVHIRDTINNTLFDNYGLASTKGQVDWIWSAFGAIVFLGSLVGTVLAGYLIPRRSHRVSLLLNAMVGWVAALIITVGAFLPSVLMMFVGKFMMGIAIAFGFSIQTVYLMKISAPHQRGAANVLSAAQIQIGIISGLVLALSNVLGNAQRWQYICVVEAVVSTVHLVGIYFLCTEQLVPVVVTDKGEKDNPVVEQKLGLMQILSDRSLRTGLLLGLLVNGAAALTGINVLVGYSAQFLHTMFSNEKASALALSITPFSCLGIAICAVLIDRVGRRPLIISSTLLCALAHLAIAVTLSMGDTPLIGYIFTSEMCVFLVFFSYGVGSISVFIAAELVPSNAAAICQSCGTCVKLGLSGLLSLVFPPLFEVVGHSMFLLFVVTLVICNVVFVMYLPETAKRDPNEVSRELVDGFVMRRMTVEANESKLSETVGEKNL